MSTNSDPANVLADCITAGLLVKHSNTVNKSEILCNGGTLVAKGSEARLDDKNIIESECMSGN